MTQARRILTSILISSLVFSGMAQAVPMTLISTEQAAAAMQPRSEAHIKLRAALDRADLAAMLQARGVSTDEMRARVDALTDAEAGQMLQQIDQAPAGGDVIGVLFTVFIVLLVTDILGVTKVFPFTRSIR